MPDKTIAQLAADVVEASDAVMVCAAAENEALSAAMNARNRLTDARNRLATARKALETAIDKSIGKG